MLFPESSRLPGATRKRSPERRNPDGGVPASKRVCRADEVNLPSATTLGVWAGVGRVEAEQLRDSTALHRSGGWSELRTRLETDGYLMLRGALSCKDVLKARKHILESLRRERPKCFRPGTDTDMAVAAPGAREIGLLGLQHIAMSPSVREVLEGTAMFDLMGQLLEDSEVVTTAFKWLRAVAPGEFTGVHTDRVFLGRGSHRLLTAWIPLGDCPVEQGSMMVVPGSHRHEHLEDLRKSYGSSQVGRDGTRSGWLSDDGSRLSEWLSCKPTQGGGGGPSSNGEDLKWHTSDFKAGDVIILALDTLHMSAANKSDRIRISCDTRWLPAAEPRDPRLATWNGRAGNQPQYANSLPGPNRLPSLAMRPQK